MFEPINVTDLTVCAIVYVYELVVFALDIFIMAYSSFIVIDVPYVIVRITPDHLATRVILLKILYVETNS
jgi:hypothetical protein